MLSYYISSIVIGTIDGKLHVLLRVVLYSVSLLISQYFFRLQCGMILFNSEHLLGRVSDWIEERFHNNHTAIRS